MYRSFLTSAKFEYKRISLIRVKETANITKNILRYIINNNVRPFNLSVFLKFNFPILVYGYKQKDNNIQYRRGAKIPKSCLTQENV